MASHPPDSTNCLRCVALEHDLRLEKAERQKIQRRFEQLIESLHHLSLHYENSTEYDLSASKRRISSVEECETLKVERKSPSIQALALLECVDDLHTSNESSTPLINVRTLCFVKGRNDASRINILNPQTSDSLSETQFCVSAFTTSLAHLLPVLRPGNKPVDERLDDQETTTTTHVSPGSISGTATHCSPPPFHPLAELPANLSSFSSLEYISPRLSDSTPVPSLPLPEQHDSWNWETVGIGDENIDDPPAPMSEHPLKLCLPLIARNKAEDSQISVPVKVCAESEDEETRAEQFILNRDILELSYQIPRPPKREKLDDPDTLVRSPSPLPSPTPITTPGPSSNTTHGHGYSYADHIPPANERRPAKRPRPAPVPDADQAPSTPQEIIRVAQGPSRAEIQAMEKAELAAIIERAKADKEEAVRRARELAEAVKEKRLLRLIGHVVVKSMSKHAPTIGHERFKKHARELTEKIAEREKKSSAYQQNKLDSLSDKKIHKIKKYAKEYIDKLVRRVEAQSKHEHRGSGSGSRTKKPLSSASASGSGSPGLGTLTPTSMML
ncbi:hypothetical protein GYMLUDRAFT_56515 [Collybiopsis luxurians FD-317 M1]|nr:hypothetical protein GYMLUDRAFT_56515 [Collybiopsis luxurians FD-317 M1]